MRRGIRFQEWWRHLVAILTILSGEGSFVEMERFATRRHRLNELLGTDFGQSPIAQTTYALDTSGEIQFLCQLLDAVARGVTA